MGNKKVLILGAGFTKAFYEDAPLLIDKYDIDNKKIEKLPYANKILNLELNGNHEGKINIERLMTRLSGYMPYDFHLGESVTLELDLLLSEVKRSFRTRLHHAQLGRSNEKEIEDFAKYCIENNIDCISFNYDDFFDRALWKTERALLAHPSESGWHPNSGYGFFCRPAVSLVWDWEDHIRGTAMLLLKLHGSINWRIKRGYHRPCYIDAIVHHEKWLPLSITIDITDPIIESHLDIEPFIVPPILEKSVFMREPILSHIWSLAHDRLNIADEITFVGYSLPYTDTVVTSLFKETIMNRCKISVVDFKTNEHDKKELINRYKKVFPGITEDQFYFNGALSWSQRLVKNSKKN